MSVRILEGDCLSVMPTLDADSIDAVICDPPYGLKFMGKQWDHGVPGVPFWEAAKRVAKPGAYLLAFGGTRTHHRLMVAIEDAGWEIRDCLMWLHGQGFPKSHNLKGGHEGWGTALKPAWEPIILARNPIATTVTANVQEHGTGALNIDGCRVAGDSWGSRPAIKLTSKGKLGGGFGQTSWETIPGKRNSDAGKGRWPANLILDEEAARQLDQMSGITNSSAGIRGGVDAGFMTNRPRIDNYALHSDSGGASRFFYTAKASRSERNAGLTDPGPQFKHGDTLRKIENKAGVVGNSHPTVKPLDLMQWLCRLITPKGGLILDPFCGSGTTGRAAVAEGFSFIGIEKIPEYAAIARDRIAEYAPLFGDVA